MAAMQKADFLRWVAPYRNVIVGTLIALAVVASLFVRMGVSGSRFVQEYVEADFLHSRILAGKLEGVRRLFAFVKKYPAMQPLFHHALYQALLLEGDLTEVKQISKEVLGRSLLLENHYRMYAEGSLLMEEGKFEEALNCAMILQADLKNLALGDYERLYVFNLLRILFLEKRLGRELSSEKELELLLSKEDNLLLGKTKEEILSHFQQGDLSLLDFYSSKR